MIDRLSAAEPFSAHPFLRGEKPAHSPRDPHPFGPFLGYTTAIHPGPAPDPLAPCEDVGFDDVLACLEASACRIRDDLVSGTCDLALTRRRIETLRGLATAHALRLERHPDSVSDSYLNEVAITRSIRLAQIADVCLAACGDRRALRRLVRNAELCLALGVEGYLPFSAGGRIVLSDPNGLRSWEPGQPPLLTISHALNVGRHALAMHSRAREAATLRETQTGPREQETHADAIEDDRAGLARLAASPTEPEPSAAEPEGPGVVVFPAALAASVGKGENKREIERFLGKTLGARLPLVPVPESWDAWEATLNGESPWLAPFHRAVRLSQGGRTHWGGGVICVEGPPGAGKSRGVRRIAEVSGLPYARFNLDATSDNAGLGGTSIRYLSGHASALERLIASSGVASVCMALDEIEKAGGSRRGGSGDPHDLLHGWFEPETACAWRSTYLLSDVDVSSTLFLCTANETASVPGSLRDRMTVVRVGGPLPEHVGVLAPALARAACQELGQDERFGMLDGDEMAALATAWEGGSIRRLRRLVETVLRARESGPAAMLRH